MHRQTGTAAFCTSTLNQPDYSGLTPRLPQLPGQRDQLQRQRPPGGRVSRKVLLGFESGTIAAPPGGLLEETIGEYALDAIWLRGHFSVLPCEAR
jgi:hypothetical protein